MEQDYSLYKVYTVIVTYNGTQWIKDCLDSLQKSRLPTQIVVVDNASTDETVLWIQQEYPLVQLIESGENLGFGKANNIGISKALNQGATHVFLLNQDAKVEPQTLSLLLDAQLRQPKYGIISPYHWNWEGTELEYYFSKFIFKNPQIISDAVKGNKAMEVYEVPFVNAAAWLLSKSTLEVIGGFDPIFYHYGEDDNYCERMHFHGYKLGIVPGANIYHDSKKRKEPKHYYFSDKYYMDEVKKLQLKYANPNAKFSVAHQKMEQQKILKWILVNLVLFNFKSVKGFAKKYNIFKKQYPLIEESRRQNVEKGPHYLNLN
jgi:GT2 family glycosyltransferase